LRPAPCHGGTGHALRLYRDRWIGRPTNCSVSGRHFRPPPWLL